MHRNKLGPQSADGRRSLHPRCGGCCCRCEPHRPNRDEARAAKLSASEARSASAPFSRSGALPVSRLSCAGNGVKWSLRGREPRCEKRSGMDVPDQVVESGPNATASPVRALSARPRGSGLALVCDRAAEGGELATPTARTKRFERARRVASHESVQACGTVRRARCSERLADRGSLPK